MYTNKLDYIKQQLERCITIPSPSGYCKEVIGYLKEEVERLGFNAETTMKGNLLITVDGQDGKSNERMLTAHVDTLGAMVRSINSDGSLRFTSVGGYTMYSVEGEYCTVHTRDGKKITGTILSNHPSVHVFDDARNYERSEGNMSVRIDEAVTSVEDVKALGIQVGDFISFDPRYVETASGYIKTRHLDDKASVAIIMGVLQYLSENQIQPDKGFMVMFSTYEEVGHGSSYIPESVRELLAVDMGAIGDDLSCTEKDLSICVKDSSGPYDYDMVGRLIDWAKELEVSYVLDVYPRYNSDATAALQAGNNVRSALIGPGTHGSHGMERTHVQALESTLNVLIAYIIKG